MVKLGRGERGLRGIPGPAGPTGPTGAEGRVGQRGARGATGAVGETGATGKQGTKGAAGQEQPRRRQLLDVVQVQISRIDRELQIQMTRMSQIQAEVDHLRVNLKKLAGKSD
jgi:hypothetical protein